MAKCGACGSTILFGGKRDGESRYCNRQCHKQGTMLALTREFPVEVVQERVRAIHRGPCPGCGSEGPVDVHTGYRVWSALLVTSWKSLPHISCRSCGVKSQALDAFFSLALGWWAFPWGFIVTPIQLGRNLVAIFRANDRLTPSAQLETCVRLALAAEAAAAAAPAPKQDS